MNNTMPQPFLLSCQGPSLTDDEKRLFVKYKPLGVCLFAKGCANVQNKVQLQNLVKQIKEVLERDEVLIAIDQEGGRVRRLLEPEWTAVAAQSDIKTVTAARMHAQLIAADLKNCGINVNFAPVLDVEYENTTTALKGRCFGADKQKIARLGRAMVDEYIKNGVCPCVKHMPGHGRAHADPHLQLPVVDASRTEMQTDFYPFKKLNDAPMGMVAHMLLTCVDAENSASCSPKVINEIIRHEIGFNGVLVSDAVMMGALKGTIAERAERCLTAGCDVICLGNADFAANVNLCESNLKMTDAAAERLLRIWQIIRQPAQINTEYVQNKYCATLKNIISYNYEYDATEVLNRLRKP